MLSKVSFFVLEHYWNNTSTTNVAVWCYVDEVGWMDENSTQRIGESTANRDIKGAEQSTWILAFTNQVYILYAILKSPPVQG